MAASDVSTSERQLPRHGSGTGDPLVQERESTAARRSRTASGRLADADHRDEAARVRDLTAAVRDRVAESSDDAAVARDLDTRGRQDIGADGMNGFMADRATLRTLLTLMRERSARERIEAADDRDAAAADRERAAADRRDAALDELTGILRRGSGEHALVNELDRSRRTGAPLVLAILDLDHLKDVNDTQGHAAGDVLLRDVPAAITSTLRSYDIAVRWGGDEFIYAMSDVSLGVAGSRLAEIQRTFEAHHPGASVSAGLAELVDGDSLESLIARADAALRRSKALRGIGVARGDARGGEGD